MTAKSAPQTTLLRLSDLSERRPNRFDLDVTDALIAQIVRDLGLLGLKRLRFSGSVERGDRESWILNAELGATATQSCVVSLSPVTTRIDAPVRRTYCPPEMFSEAGQEVEMPEDDTLEPLNDEIDLTELAIESLSLNLPDYPRADEAALAQSNFAAPGVTPMSDADAHPFAALSKLRNDMDKE